MTEASDKMAIRSLIRAGWGVEDINVKTGIHIDRVRFYVRQMRAEGVLSEIWPTPPTQEAMDL